MKAGAVKFEVGINLTQQHQNVVLRTQNTYFCGNESTNFLKTGCRIKFKANLPFRQFVGSKALFLVTREVWNAGNSTSNLIESVHADINREGVRCTLVGRDCHGFEKPMGFAMALSGVWVRVQIFVPPQNPYPSHGYGG